MEPPTQPGGSPKFAALDDAALVALSLAGRQAAFAEIVTRHKQPLYRLDRLARRAMRTRRWIWCRRPSSPPTARSPASIPIARCARGCRASRSTSAATGRGGGGCARFLARLLPIEEGDAVPDDRADSETTRDRP